MAQNFTKMMKQAQKMQSQLMQAQDDLNKKIVEGSAGGGMVKIVLNGSQELQSVKINPQAVDPNDVEMLEDMIVAAFKNAQQKVKELSDSTLGSITAGLNIPGLS